MRVSIVIPSFNQQEYLADAVESALAQTVPCEVIIVDDGSTDASLWMSKKYPVKVVSQVNKGLSSARNTGIMNASGEFILPLDADDILMENCVEKLLALQEKTSADIVAPSFKQFGFINVEVIVDGAPTLEQFKSANRIGYFSMVRRSALLEIGGYSPRMYWGYEDYHLWINLLQRGKTLACTKEVLVLYRTKERSMIHVALEHHSELVGQIIKDFPQVYATKG